MPTLDWQRDEATGYGIVAGDYCCYEIRPDVWRSYRISGNGTVLCAGSSLTQAKAACENHAAKLKGIS